VGEVEAGVVSPERWFRLTSGGMVGSPWSAFRIIGCPPRTE